MDQEAEGREVKRVEDLEAAALKPFTDAEAEAAANAAVEAAPYFRRHGEPEPSKIETVDQAHAKDGVDDGDFSKPSAFDQVCKWMLYSGFVIGDAASVPELLNGLVFQIESRVIKAQRLPPDSATAATPTDHRTSQREERRQKRLAEKGY